MKLSKVKIDYSSGLIGFLTTDLSYYLWYRRAEVTNLVNSPDQVDSVSEVRPFMGLVEIYRR
ncbi:MAG: hypothetical protein ACTMUP_06470 [cyanobacterium endosymbiont of Rhopalodia musculus]